MSSAPSNKPDALAKLRIKRSEDPPVRSGRRAIVAILALVCLLLIVGGAVWLGKADIGSWITVPDAIRSRTEVRVARATVETGRSADTSESALARWRSRHIGFIFQLYNLIPVLTAYENVELPLTLTRLSRRERDEHVRAALEVVGLSDRIDHYPRQLSGGQEQRVSIARAVATDPTLLVADEPTGDLDATSAREILDLLERLNQEFEKTIVMVTHDPNAADRAHRLLHLEKGLLVDDVNQSQSHAAAEKESA